MSDPIIIDDDDFDEDEESEVFVQLATVESCEGCGLCCTRMNSPPFVLIEESDSFHSLPMSVKESWKEGIRQRQAAGWPDGVPCFWYDEEKKQCSHYEHRPQICRDFEVGGEDCCQWREQL